MNLSDPPRSTKHSHVTEVVKVSPPFRAAKKQINKTRVSAAEKVQAPSKGKTPSEEGRVSSDHRGQMVRLRCPEQGAGRMQSGQEGTPWPGLAVAGQVACLTAGQVAPG